MTGFTLFRLKNLMLAGNFVSNFIGVQVVNLIVTRTPLPFPPELISLNAAIDRYFLPLTYVAGFSFTLVYEWPIRRYLDRIHRLGEPVPAAEALKARQRLLNEPFALIACDMAIWTAAAILYPLAFQIVVDMPHITGRMFFQTILVGLVTSIIAFFVLERALQNRLAPHFFPDGGLYATPKTVRIRIRVKLTALVIACNIVPCVAFMGIWRGTFYPGASPEACAGSGPPVHIG